MLSMLNIYVQVKGHMEKEDNDDLYKQCVNAGGGSSQYISWLSGDKVRDIVCNIFDVLFTDFILFRDHFMMMCWDSERRSMISP